MTDIPHANRPVPQRFITHAGGKKKGKKGNNSFSGSYCDPLALLALTATLS